MTNDRFWKDTAKHWKDTAKALKAVGKTQPNVRKTQPIAKMGWKDTANPLERHSHISNKRL